MKPQARQLALGILTRIKEREGTANKTKLLTLTRSSKSGVPTTSMPNLEPLATSI
jgi:hypothetical protein